MPRTKKLGSVFIFFLLSLYPASCFGQEAAAAKGIRTVRYLFSIDAAASGYPLSGTHALFVDNAHEELYMLDDSNQRAVITTLSGIFLYQFKYADAGITSTPIAIIATEDGLLYIAEEKRIVITSYRGVYQRDMNLSSIPDMDSINIQSMAVEEGLLYIGDGVNSRIVVMDRKKETLVTELKEGLGHNVFIALGDNDIYVRDTPMFNIIHLDKKGKPVGRWGIMSSLAGGFSMPADMAVDRKNRRVLVLDINRLELIFFDLNGNFVFEFGGPETFRSPFSVAIDNKDRVYVFDGKVRVFQIIAE